MTRFVEFVMAGVICAMALCMNSAYRGKAEAQEETARVTVEFNAYKLAAEKKHAAALEAAMNTRLEQEKLKDEAIARAEARAAAAESRAADLRRQSASLRDELASANARLSTAPDAAVREYAAALNVVFGECQAAYADMAGKAEGHAADVRLLKESWPR